MERKAFVSRYRSIDSIYHSVHRSELHGCSSRRMKTIIIERKHINVEVAKRLLDAWMERGECDIRFVIKYES